MKNNGLDILFPRFCLGCGYVGAYICPACEDTMKRAISPHCFYCKKKSHLGFTHPSCRVQNGVDGCISLYRYDGLFKKALMESKYHGAWGVLVELLSFPHDDLSQTLKVWEKLYMLYLQAVPLHPQRLKERGFNQSEIIKNALFLSPPTAPPSILMRKINTEHLANIGNKLKRNKHIRGAFSHIDISPPKAVLLIDDVITSGSTIAECAKTLKRWGVQTVLAFSLAKG